MGKNLLKLDVSGFEEMLSKLDEVGGNVKRVTDKALTKAAETITQSTETALSMQYLPGGGKYSTGDTEKSIVHANQPTWEGLTASIPVGFDFSKVGAGGFLISGTPRMRPDQQLRRIYKSKRYMNHIQGVLERTVMDYVIEEMSK